MIDVINYFNDNKESILECIGENKHIFPNMFIDDVKILHDENLYETASKNPILGYLFSIENIKIFTLFFYLFLIFY
jgi:hypothetical protein